MNPNPYEPQDFWVSEQQIQATQATRAAQDKKNRPRPRPTHKTPTKSRFRGQFVKLPTSVLEALIEGRAPRSVWTLVVALQELWFTHPNHYNPVHLTTPQAQRFGLSRWQKWRALALLEKCEQISINIDGRAKNPWVTLRWQELRYPHGS